MNWKEEVPGAAPNFHAIAGMDPYANWALNWGWNEFNRGDEEVIIPFVIAILGPETADILETNRVRHQENALNLLPVLISPVNPPFEVGRYISLFAKRQFFLDLAASDEARYKDLREAPKRIKLGLPLKASQQQDLTWYGTGAELERIPRINLDQGLIQPVVIGIIDDGIAFANDRF